MACDFESGTILVEQRAVGGLDEIEGSKPSGDFLKKGPAARQGQRLH